MIGLCVMERYYLLGLYRVHYFGTMRELEQYRMGLDRGVVSWILGEPIPKRRNYSIEV